MCTRASREPVHSRAVRVVPFSSVPAATSRTASVAPCTASARRLRTLPAGMSAVSRNRSAATAALLAGGAPGPLTPAAPWGRGAARGAVAGGGGGPRRTVSVGDREEAGARVGGVLVGGADQARVRVGGVTKFEHGGVLPRCRRQLVDEERGEVPPYGRLRLHLRPVRADLVGG